MYCQGAFLSHLNPYSSKLIQLNLDRFYQQIMTPSADLSSTRSTPNMDFTSFSNVINGKLSSTSQTTHAINPATKKPNWEVPISTSRDVDQAVAAARTAFKTWSKTTLVQRKAALEGWSAEIAKHVDEFAKLLVIEQGKPVSKGSLLPSGIETCLTQWHSASMGYVRSRHNIQTNHQYFQTRSSGRIDRGHG